MTSKDYASTARYPTRLATEIPEANRQLAISLVKRRCTDADLILMALGLIDDPEAKPQRRATTR